ncbi:hypothetical protein V5R04_07100 [Jonesiaceae bacterium BS-20]|uniref:Uncharacterized protein n=1 Tax=Jonesiaceae bacterium BS-20 TaxID=3120821 RepID=A0AAU7E0Q1_9MICO
MTSKTTPNRGMQQDARAWLTFTDSHYLAAQRQVSSPLAQGILGPRISARKLIRTLQDHPLIGANGGEQRLGDNGYGSTLPWSFNGTSDYIQLALIIEVLRMFTPVSDDANQGVSSYALKHTAERFLEPHLGYVSNGQLIWAAAALGLPLSAEGTSDTNLMVGVSEREHDYVNRMASPGRRRPVANHFQPAGYEFLKSALPRAAAGEILSSRFTPPAIAVEPAPFHDWLSLQTGRHDPVGDLARDYDEGVHSSDHDIARTPDQMLTVLQGVPHAPEAYIAVVGAIGEWMRINPSAPRIRTELVNRDHGDHRGWGAGAGTVERYEYLCPCGDGVILEEHDNIPGFRENDVRILCPVCSDLWQLVYNRGVRDWGLEPKL